MMATQQGPYGAQRRTGGVIAGSAGILFAVAGIVTIGVLFVPIAVVFTLVGLACAAIDRCVMGFWLSASAGALCLIGYATSPLLWRLV
jgi:hypothetical protein